MEKNKRGSNDAENSSSYISYQPRVLLKQGKVTDLNQLLKQQDQTSNKEATLSHIEESLFQIDQGKTLTNDAERTFINSSVAEEECQTNRKSREIVYEPELKEPCAPLQSNRTMGNRVKYLSQTSAEAFERNNIIIAKKECSNTKTQKQSNQITPQLSEDQDLSAQ